MKIYLDHNACTPVDPRVLRRFIEVERATPANPASLHGSGRSAARAVEDARDALAGALDAQPDQLVFVSGGTEANNLIVNGAGDTALPVLLAPVEHPSVTVGAERRGAVWWQVRPDATAAVTAVDQPIGLVCLVHAQSEVGTLQPLEQARAVADDAGVPLHVDAAQTLGRVDLRPVLQLADSITFSAHKAAGLRGASVVWLRHPASIAPLIRGGGQERGHRAGTVSPALAAATALAVQLAVDERAQRAAHMGAALDAFETAMAAADARRLTPTHAIPNTAAYLFAGIDGRALMPALDLAGVQASQGSACSSGAPSPPRVLTAMGLDEHDARSCVRFSVSHTTSIDDARAAGHAVADAIAHLRARRAARP